MSGDSGGLPEEHEEHVNHEAWVIPYADLLTLLMAMFIALFAISTVDTSKFKELVGRVQRSARRRQARLARCSRARSRRTTSPIPGNGYGSGPGSGGSLVASKNILTASQLTQLLNATQQLPSAKAQGGRDAQERADSGSRRRARAGGFGNDIHTELQARGLVVTVVTDKVLFDSGSADAAHRRADRCSTLVGDALKAVPNPILIDGYTDNGADRDRRSTRRTSSSPSARADRVARYFMSIGVDESALFPDGLWALATRSRRTPRPPAARATAGSRSSCSQRSCKQTLDNAGLDKTPATTPKPVAAPVLTARSRRRRRHQPPPRSVAAARSVAGKAPTR